MEQNVWKQWDLQDAKRIAREKRAAELMAQNAAYIELNNLYLKVERGEVRMSVSVGNTLRTLATKAYDQGDSMADWWGQEFQKLPRWNDF